LLDELFAATQVDIASFDETQFHLAREVVAKFGKGRHPASLNFGDCCAYALARKTGEPLLFKGHAFSATDISVAA
jgi:ribonuclease VapC